MLSLDTLIAATPVLQCAAPGERRIVSRAPGDGSSYGTELHYLRAAKTGSTSTMTLLASASGSTQPGSHKGNWSLVLHQGHRTMRASLPVHAHTLTTLREPCERFESGFHWARPRKEPHELPAFRYGFHRASRATGVSPGITPLGWASRGVRQPGGSWPTRKELLRCQISLGKYRQRQACACGHFHSRESDGDVGLMRDLRSVITRHHLWPAQTCAIRQPASRPKT